MENTLLLLQERHIDAIAKELDDAFDFKEIIKNKIAGTLVEAADGKLAKISLNFSNVRISQYIPDSIKDEIHTALDDIFDGDKNYNIAINNAMDILSQLTSKLEVKPFIKSIIDSLIGLINAALIMVLEKQKD